MDDNEPQKLSDPLFQIIQVFKKHAVRTAANESIQSDQLYLHYAELMARSCGECECDDDGEDDDGEEQELSFEEKETEKQHLLYCQERWACLIKSTKIYNFIRRNFSCSKTFSSKIQMKSAWSKNKWKTFFDEK